MDASEKKKMEKVVDDMNKADVDATIKVFRTAYYVAKNERPYSDHPKLIELQVLNGGDIGIGLRSLFSATSIIDNIAKEMKNKICSNIVELEKKIPILVDESTAHGKSILIIYLKVQTSKEESDSECFFLDLVELKAQASKVIIASVLDCLLANGFSDEFLRSHLVAFASDC